MPLVAAKAASGAADNSRRVQLGVTLELPRALASSDIQWRKAADGRYAGYLRVRSQGASGMRIYLELPRTAPSFEARFRAAGSGMAAFVALRGRSVEEGGLWSPIVPGDTIEAEILLSEPPSRARQAFTVTRASALTKPLAAAEKAIGGAGACERDVKCYSLTSAALNNAKATALLLVTTSSGTFGCTGTLLNTSTSSHVPYVLTDADCVTSQADASTLNALWDYQATACGSNTAQSFTRTSAGATLLVRDAGRHFSFVQLSEAAPADSWFSGWDANAPALGTPVAAVHHPESDLKKLSQGSIAVTGTPLSVRFTSGVTEGGSVGGGIFSSDVYLVGILYAGASSCSNPSGLDQYWPLADMWPQLEAYLRPSSAAANYSDIWFNPNESGWGLTIADHETQLFLVWYTYRVDGTPTWFVIPGGTFTQGRRIFTGTMYQTTGPAYDGPFNPSAVTVSQVGDITIDFAPPGLAAGWANFTYHVGNVSRTVAIERQSFGNAQPNWGSDFTDIWWNPNESGWGLTLAQHGNNIFGVWYTYDLQGRPLFVVMPGVTFTSPGAFVGDLYTTTGPYFGNASFDSSQVHATKVGSASVAFSSVAGNANANKIASFNPVLNGFFQSKSISGQPFGHASPASGSTHHLQVSLSGTGSGTVTSQPGGISCGGACGADFSSGSTVTLTASPAANSRFVSFTGTCSSPSTSCTVSMTADASVNAQFDALPPPSTLAIHVLALPNAIAGQSYSAQVASATGGTPPYHYQSDTFANGTPPPGMSVTPDGHLQGTPSSAITSTQTYTFGVCVVDLSATSRCAQTSITVNPAAPAQTGTIGWTIADECNNGMEIDYKFFDRANNWVWPGPSTHYFVTNGQSGISISLKCFPGGQVCLGGQSSDASLYWGVGFAGTQGCSSCCGSCDGRTYGFTFACNTPPPSGGTGQCTGASGGPQACQACNSDADCGANYCWKGNLPAPFCG